MAVIRNWHICERDSQQLLCAQLMFTFLSDSLSIVALVFNLL